MTRRRSLVIAMCLAAAIVGLVLLLRQERQPGTWDDLRSPKTSSIQVAAGTLASPGSAADAPRAAVLAPDDAVAPSAPAPAARLRVRSAEGLALATIEAEDEPGRWRHVALDEGTCDRALVRLPCRIRAPGHVAATAMRLEDEVVLDADALLVIEGADLRRCAGSIQPFPWLALLDTDYAPALRERFARAATHGFTGSDRWAIAVSGDGLGESFGPRYELVVHVEDGAYRLVVVKFQATAGARGRWTLPCTAGLATAPLELTVVRPRGPSNSEIACTLRAVDTGRESLVVLPQAWGEVALQPGLRFQHETRVSANESRCRVERVPLGERAVVTVLDDESHAYGRLFFVHDGTPRSVRMHAGFTLSGRIVVPEGSIPPADMRMSFGRAKQPPDREDELEPFASELTGVPIARDGTFAVSGPRRVPLWEELSAEPPAVLLLIVEGTGFERHTSQWPLGDATHVDCGDILLVPSFAPLALARGHGFTGADLAWKTLRIGPGEADSWTVRCGRVELDDSMALVFDWDWLVRNEPGTSRAFVSAPEIMPHGIVPAAASTEAFVIDIDGDRGRAFVRGPDGRYERVEEREYTIELVSYASIQPASNLTLSWSWRGIPQRLETLGPDRSSQRRTLRFTAPRDSARLCWSGTDSPVNATGSNDPLTGSLPLDRASATVELP